MLEAAERRVLGALRFIDAATGLPVRQPLLLRSDSATLRRNASGDWVLFSAPALASYAASFDAPPAQPAPGSVEVAIDVRDPQGRYLPRRCVLKLPRDADPAHAAAADSLFVPQLVRLYASPALPVAPNWASARITVLRSGSDARIANAFVRITPALGAVGVARGFTDAAGEALVVVPGIPKLMASGNGNAVVTDHIDATLSVVVDAALARFVAPAQLPAARSAALRDAGPYADPDDLESRAAQLAHVEQNIQLSSGASLRLNVQVPA